MKGTIRISLLAFLLVFIFSLCTVSVFADEEEEPVATDPAPVVTEAPAPATAAPKPVTQPTKKATTPATKSTQAATKKQTQATRAENYNSNNNNNNNNNNSYSANTNRTATQATRKAIVSDTKAATSAVYDVNKEKIATGTLKKDDWASIKEKLSKSDSDDSKNDADSFSYIQENTSDGDNGIWILYTGIGLEILAGLIILTLIILAIRRRKVLRRKYADAPAMAAASQRQHSAAPRRSSQAPPSRTQKRQVSRRSKYDTDEIYTDKNRRQSKGGRYKPRH